jgi:hypothetical protein
LLGGGVAQLGERLLCKQEVIGSIPFTSTKTSLRVSGECAARTLRIGRRKSIRRFAKTGDVLFDMVKREVFEARFERWQSIAGV